MNENRINIAPFAREFRQNGYTHSADSEKFAKGDDFFAMHESMKPELYALTSILSDIVVKDAYDKRESRPPLGLLTVKAKGSSLMPSGERKIFDYRPVDFDDLDEAFPYFSISDYVRETIFQSMLEKFKLAEYGIATPKFLSIYFRINEMVLKLAEHYPYTTANRFGGGTGGFIASGVNFAAVTMSGALDVIDKMTNGDLATIESRKQIAQNSYPFIIKLASGQFEPVVKSVNAMSEAYPGGHLLFDPRYFTIVERHNGLALEVSNVGRAVLKNQGLSIDEPDPRFGATVGCPATVNFEDGSAIKHLWDWHVEIAEKMHQQFSKAA